MNGKLLNSKKEVVRDYILKQFIKNILSLGFLDGFPSLITLVSLIFSHPTNVKDIFKD